MIPFTQSRRRSGSQRSNTTPSLVLPFALDKSLDPRITFTRADVGTYWDENSVLQTAAVDEPRFTHDPATGESLGLLVEGAATNLLVYSEDFNNAAWTKYRGSVQSNVIIAPDGTLTGDKFVKSNGETAASGVGDGVTHSAAIHSVSVYAKAGEVTQIRLQPESSSAYVTAQFDLSNGTIIGTNLGSGTVISQKIEPVGNGWYRCSVVWNVAAGAGQFQVFGLVAGDGAWTGNGVDGFYIWGAQLETGSKATSYIKTEASTVTRAADVATMTGTNFSDWYNASEGTFYVEAEWDGGTAVANNREALSVTDAGTSNRVSIVNSSDKAVFYVENTGAAQALISDSIPRIGHVKIAAAYKINDFAVSFLGGAVGTDISGTMPSVDRMTIGGIVVSGAQLNGTIAKLAYYPRRLPDAQLQVITA